MTETSELRGVLVVAQEEGAQLGIVTGVNIDMDEKVIAAIRFRPKGLGRKEHYAPIKHVHAIGRDVVFVSTETAMKNPSEEAMPGKSVRDLQGVWVTTVRGRHIGTLVDVDFDRATWKVSLLKLAEDRQLAVNADEISIGDEIMVPAEYEERVEAIEADKEGIISRLFGAERVDDISRTLRRALKREEKKDKVVESMRIEDDDDTIM